MFSWKNVDPATAKLEISWCSPSKTSDIKVKEISSATQLPLNVHFPDFEANGDVLVSVRGQNESGNWGAADILFLQQSLL